MSWTTPADLKAQLARLWERGELARLVMQEEAPRPIRIVLKGPSSAELTERFEAARHWAAALAAMPHIRIEWREVRHRVQGVQRLPDQAWLDTPDDALALLGKRRDAERLLQVVTSTRTQVPSLLPWISRRPMQAIALADEWARLLAVVRWLIDHPRPAIYVRQVDVPLVHSKFIEAHRAVLSELLDLALPSHAIRVEHSGIAQFDARYGFLIKPVRIRFRVLDDSLRLLPGGARQPDISLDADSFAYLDTPIRRVLITENEINFLALPPLRNAIAVFGAGYGWDALAKAAWLARCRVHYWGDIDTHGFAILDQLRGRLQHVTSFLMDRDTLLAHEPLWGEEPSQVVHDLRRLDTDERALFDDLRDNRIRRNLRLEQERVGFQWIIRALAQI